MKSKLPLAALFVALMFGAALGATATDQTSSKNEVMAKGATPHIRFIDDDGTGNYDLTVDGGITRLNGLSGNAFFNLPPTGTLGIELTPPTMTSATPASGGSLTNGTYFFEVVATDGGSGETNVSNELTCTIVTPTTTKCTIVYTPVSMVVTNYRIYKGSSIGAENLYKTQTCTSGPCTFNWTSDSGAVSKVAPKVSSAYVAKLTQSGLVFIDGSSESTAGGASTWAFSGANILSAATGKVGIFDGLTAFTPAGKLGVVVSGGDAYVSVDAYGFARIPGVTLRKAEGTFASPTATGISQVLGKFGIRPFDGVSFPTNEAAFIQWTSTEAHTVGALGSRFEVAVTQNGQTVPTVGLTIDNDGEGLFSNRVRGTNMVHRSDKFEDGNGANVTLTFGIDTVVATASAATYSGLHKVRISASGNGFGSAVFTGGTIMTMTVKRDSTPIGQGEVTWQACSLCGSDGSVPWSITIELEETPSAGSHTYTLILHPNGTSAFTFYNAVYLTVDELA
jgi:hypothetical protein